MRKMHGMMLAALLAATVAAPAAMAQGHGNDDDHGGPGMHRGHGPKHMPPGHAMHRDDDVPFSLTLGLYAVVAWLFHAAALPLGFFHGRKAPAAWIGSRVVQDIP